MDFYYKVKWGKTKTKTLNRINTLLMMKIAPLPSGVITIPRRTYEAAWISGGSAAVLQDVIIGINKNIKIKERIFERNMQKK